MSWVAICKRLSPNSGRDRNQTYVNVIHSARQLSVNAATFVASNPTHPWSDPANNEYIVDISDSLGESINDNSFPLFHDQLPNLPLWQNENEGSATAYAPGSFADPEDNQSVFNADVPLIDERWIIRFYDANPSGSGVHVAGLDWDELSGPQDKQTVHMKLFNPNDTPSGTDAQNQQVDIGGRLMIFDFSNGETTFLVRTDVAGEVRFPSNHRYRVAGPSGEKTGIFRIFGRTLVAPAE